MNININFSNKRVLYGVILLMCVLALVVYSPNLVSLTSPQECFIGGVCEHEQHANFLTGLIPVFILLGIGIGVAVSFFMSSKIENREKELKKVVSALTQFLAHDEKLVIQSLLENNGKVLQAEISRMDGLGKLKAHRIIQRMLGRGVIEVERFGKTNVIKLSKGIRDALLVWK